MKKLLALFVLTMSCALTCVGQNSTFTIEKAPQSVEAGKTFEVVAKFCVASGYHLYSPDSKDFIPTKVSPILPEGFTLENIQYPEPKPFEFMGVKASGYSEDFSVAITIKAPNFAVDKADIKFGASWLECGKNCVPMNAEKQIQLTVSGPSKTAGSRFWSAMLGAVLGGLILNAMPCVFPVIGLKILSFSKSAAAGSAAVVKNSVIFSAGIILTFGALGAALAALKTFGAEVGWGFQLQNPAFAFAMCAVFLLTGLNFAGFWEFGSWISASAQNASIKSKSRSEMTEAFLSGVLAVLVASPCVAPFMASAVGFALAAEASAFECTCIVTAVGLGMAIPYIILAARPQLLKKLPKSGTWLETLRKILSIPMFATAAWLFWVFINQNGGIFAGAAALALLSAAAFVWGKYANALQTPKTRALASAFCAAALAASIAVVYAGTRAGSASAEQNSQNAWSVQKVEQLRKEGRYVFVNFTASWCITCQVNKAVLASETVKETLKKYNAEYLVADWTNRNSTIAEELKKYKLAGVPMYLVFSPDLKKEPVVLSSILTPSEIAEAFDKLNQ